MIKLIACLLAALALYACGAPEDGALQLGSVSEASMGASRPGNKGYGISVSSANNYFRCVTNSPGQDCLIPSLSTKNVRVCIASDNLLSYYSAGAQQGVSDIALQSTGWTVTYGVKTLAQCNTDYANDVADYIVKAVSQTCGSSGSCTTASAIDFCICTVPFVGSAITESQQGTYHQMLGGDVYIDTYQLGHMTGVTTTDLQNIVAHGVAHSLVALMGEGANAHVASSINATDTGVGLSSFGRATTLTAGELCQLNDFYPYSVGSYSISFDCSM